ncbi:UNVERIFIED_ORG: ribosomal protein S21 [Rhizobium etli]
MQVLVRDNNIDQALRALKKKMQREGLFPRNEGTARL